MADNEVLFTPGGPQPGSPVAPTPVRKGAPEVLFRPQAKPEEVSFRKSLSTAFALDSPVAAVARLNEAAGLPIDTSFLLTPEVQNEYTSNVPKELQLPLLDALTEATSRKHADIIKSQFLTEVEREALLQRAGMGGLATRLLASFIDPVNIGLAWATGGVGLLTKASALQGALRVGAWTAAESAAIESAVVAASHTRGVDDVVLSALAGFALGGAVGGVLGRRTALGDRTVADTATATSRQTDDIKAAALEAAGLDSAGAARVQGYTEPLMEPDVARQFDISGSPDVPKAAFGQVRFDAVGRLGIDEDPWIRDLGRTLAEEAVGVQGHGVVKFGASEWAAITHRRLMTDFRRVSEPQFNEWLTETRTGWMGKYNLAKRDDFFNEVGKAVFAGDHPSPAVRKAAQATSRAFGRYLDELKRTGVKGFEDIPHNARFMPHIHSHTNIREIVARYGSVELERLVRAGMTAAADDLDPKVVRQIAKGYVAKVRRMAQGMDIGMAHGLRMDDVDFLKSMLRETDLDEDAIEAVVQTTKKSVEKSSKVSRAKGRLRLDETAAIRVKDNVSGEMRDLSVSDIFETNAEKVLFAYSRSMSGWIGLAKRAGIKSPADVQKILNNVRARGERFGKDIKTIDANADRVGFLIKGITGVPLESDPASLFARSARAARDFNFLRIGAAFGMAQLAEIGNLLGTIGVRNMIAQLPSLRGMIKRGVDGKLTNDLAADIEDLLAPGTDRLLNQASTRWEEHGFGFAGKGSLARTIDDGLQTAKRATADIGGLNGATIVFQRAAASGIAQKLAGFAHGAKLSKGQQRRLKSMGIADDMWKHIEKQMKQHATTRDSFVPGRKKLMAINPEKWDDPDALDTFTMAVHREARRVVQENDIGTSTPWLHTTTGKILTQFRSFVLTSWSKSTLHNIHNRDFQSWSVLMYSMFFGGMAYIAQQSINVADKKKREERLTPEEIAKAAFQRTAIASFVPGMIDTAATTAFRMDPIFAYGRSSGLATGFVQGNPTVDLYDKLARAAGLPAVALRPDVEMSKRDYRTMTGLVPVLGGLIGVRRVLDATAEKLAE